jgi:hypothetical protein
MFIFTKSHSLRLNRIYRKFSTPPSLVNNPNWLAGLSYKPDPLQGLVWECPFSGNIYFLVQVPPPSHWIDSPIKLASIKKTLCGMPLPSVSVFFSSGILDLSDSFVWATPRFQTNRVNAIWGRPIESTRGLSQTNQIYFVLNLAEFLYYF